MIRQADKDQITRQIQDVLSGLPSLRVAYLYGSLLTREDFRDIDIALLVDKEIGDGAAPSYASWAADLIEAAIGYRYECEVRVLNNEPAWFRYEVISTGTPLCIRDEDDRVDFETAVLVEYQDLKFMYDLFDREYLVKA